MGAALHALWVYQMEHGKDVSLEDVVEPYITLDESTRVKPKRARCRDLSNVDEGIQRPVGSAPQSANRGRSLPSAERVGGLSSVHPYRPAMHQRGT